MSVKASHVHAPENCRRYLGDLTDYVDGTLSQELCQEIEAHMALCDNCRVVVNTLTKTVLLYRTMASLDMPDGVKERLYKVLHLEALHTPATSNDQPQDDEG